MRRSLLKIVLRATGTPAVAGALGAMFTVWGCTQSGPPPSALSTEPMTASEKVAVLPVVFFDQPTLIPRPVAGAGAGARTGALGGTLAPLMYAPIAPPMVLLAPLTGIYGAIYGASAARSE